MSGAPSKGFAASGLVRPPGVNYQGRMAAKKKKAKTKKKKSKATHATAKRAARVHGGRDEAREDRITMEVVVDAYGPEEQAMGWYYYLDDKISFPVTVRCIEERSISPLSVGDETTIVGMAPESECMREMFVETPWGKRVLAVPLSQLEPVSLDEDDDAAAATLEAIGDWHYWRRRGYELG